MSDASTNRPIAKLDSTTTMDVVSDPAGLSVTRKDAKKWTGAAIVFASTTDAGTLKIERVSLDGKKGPIHEYRGRLTVQSSGNGPLQVVNSVDVEQYLYGVLGPEMGRNAPDEALKAQAVAARTYALKNAGRFAAQGYDLEDTSRCQLYDGVDGESARVLAAVYATSGQVLTYGGALIDASYSTDSGGMTAPDPTGSEPYLQAVLDAPGPDLPDYGSDHPNHAWTLELSQKQLVDLLNGDPRTHVSMFVSLTIDSWDESGRIVSATVSAEDGSMRTVPGTVLREILGVDKLRSTRATLTVRANGDFLFSGKGWGHGLGMSQIGAVAMASPPYNHTYLEILGHYYVGAVCSTGQSATLTPDQ